jgi:fumarate hydratase class II
MIQGLAKNSAKINPLLLSNLQKIYLARAKVFKNNQTLKEQNLDSVFEEPNFFKDGQGGEILKKFDNLFNFSQHNAFPEKQYEYLNTSFTDAIYLTSVVETKHLISEIQELINTFMEQSKKIAETSYKAGRIRGISIDLQTREMFINWAEYLQPFIKYLEDDIKYLQKSIPLGSDLHTNNQKIKGVFNRKAEQDILSQLNKDLGTEFKSAEDRVIALSQFSPIIQLSGTLNNLATVSMKIANDVRFLSSGPRSGFGELAIPENEPGSSIMPGKVNPTQCESLTMLSCQVIGNHNASSIANASSMFESSSFKPLIGNNTVRSIKLLTDGLKSFRLHCAIGIELIDVKIKENLNTLI